LISPVIRACSARSRAVPAPASLAGCRPARPGFREAIRFVAIDPAAVYAKAVTTPGLLPNAVLVVDHFHLVKLANEALTKVRRRVIWEQQGRRGRKIDPAWANRRRLLTAKQRLSPKAFAAMWNSREE
jgi:transposase